MRRSRWTLAFHDEELERDYRRHRNDAVHGQYGAIAVAAAILWAASAFLEMTSAGAETKTILVLRFSIGEVSLLPAIVVAWLPRRHFDRLWHGAMVLVAVGIGASLLVMAAVTRYALLHFLAGMCLLIVSAHTLAPLRFAAASILTGLFVVVYALVITVIQPLDHSLVATNLYFVLFSQALAMVASYHLEDYQRRDFLQAKLLGEERARADALLHNVLPAVIAERLKGRERRIAEHFPVATVLFGDLVGFTPLSERLPPDHLVDALDRIFSEFDDLADRHGVEKIKTIGDAYMLVGGVPLARPDHAEAVAAMALDMMRVVERADIAPGVRLKMRIGIHTGPVVAGVIGKRKFIYDLWGDTVNTASRMESHGVEGGVQVTRATYELLRDRWRFEPRGPVTVKGKGELPTWLLLGRLDSDVHPPRVPLGSGETS